MNDNRRVVSLIIMVFAIGNSSVISMAQQSLRTINATSKEIAIIDGDDQLTGVIVPELDPDVYVYHPSSQAKTISIITDIDRLDVIVEPGKSYDFVIFFDGKQCKQRLSPVSIVYESKNKGGDTDLIPFKLGLNNAIHIKGSINQSKHLDLIFDTGASVGVLSDEGRAKGVSIVEGNHNQIELDSVAIAKSPMVYIDYGGKLRADGVVGYNAFIGKVVRIDYERELLSVYDRMPELDASYTKAELVWRGAGTFVPITLGHGNTAENTLALFDTGSRWSLSLEKEEKFNRENFSKVTGLGWRTGVMANGTRVSSKVFSLDRLTIAGHTLMHVQSELEGPSQEQGLHFNILGNDFLKRFNVVIDYRESAVYLQPNGLINAAYNSVFDSRLAMSMGGLTLGIVIIAGYAYWKRQANRSIRA